MGRKLSPKTKRKIRAKKQRYSAKTMLEVVAYATRHRDISLPKVADHFNIPATTVYRWVGLYGDGEPRNPKPARREQKSCFDETTPPETWQAYRDLCESLAAGFALRKAFDIEDVVDPQSTCETDPPEEEAFPS